MTQHACPWSNSHSFIIWLMKRGEAKVAEEAEVMMKAK